MFVGLHIKQKASYRPDNSYDLRELKNLEIYGPILDAVIQLSNTMSAQPITYVLLTGATGFIGAHVLDILLQRGLRVRVAVRNLEKARLLGDARPEYAHKLDFVQVADYGVATSFKEAVMDVEGIVHVASVSPPSTY